MELDSSDVDSGSDAEMSVDFDSYSDDEFGAAARECNEKREQRRKKDGNAGRMRE